MNHADALNADEPTSAMVCEGCAFTAPLTFQNKNAWFCVAGPLPVVMFGGAPNVADELFTSVSVVTGSRSAPSLNLRWRIVSCGIARPRLLCSAEHVRNAAEHVTARRRWEGLLRVRRCACPKQTCFSVMTSV
jgi:hypothetical protein